MPTQLKNSKCGSHESCRLAKLIVADKDNVVDRASKSAHGNAERGDAHFATLCAGCHGDDGRMEEMPALGPLARKNPWEPLHKVLNGQPDCAMPALRTLDRRVALDIVTFTQTLPGDE